MSNVASQRSRGWCITAHTGVDGITDTADEFKTRYQRLWLDPANESLVRPDYICHQREIGAESGAVHHQGYIYWAGKARFNAVIKFCQALYAVKAHIAPARGTAAENRTYCSKPDTAVPETFWEDGVMPEQGKRSDMEQIADKVKDGESLREIAQSFPGQFMRYNKGIVAYQTLMNTEPRDPAVAPTVYWLFGPTGVGKSKYAYETFPAAYSKMTTNKWWDGYNGEKEVIMDDYRAGMVPFSELLKILDRYRHRVEIKGISCELSATVFVITTTSRPEVTWHSRTDEALGQLIRRITDIVEYLPDGQTVVRKSAEIPYQPLSREELNDMFPEKQAMTFNP